MKTPFYSTFALALSLSWQANAQQSPDKPPQEATVAEDHAPAKVEDSGRASSFIDGSRLLTAQALTRSDWWTGFGDPMLNRLIRRALAQNYDARAAELRVHEVKRSSEQQRAPTLPSLDWNSRINVGPTDSLGFQLGAGGGAQEAPDLYWTGSSELTLAYEIDLTGRRWSSLRASQDEARSAGLDSRTVHTTTAANVALAYFELSTARARVAIVEDQIATAKELLELTEARFAQGGLSASDLLQQRQKLAETQVLEPAARALVRSNSRRLAALLGEAPETRYQTVANLPALPGRTPQMLPKFLETRSEVRSARYRVTAAEKRERAARMEFVPTLAASASVGYQAMGMVEVNDQSYWGAGATLSIPLFSGGKTLADLRLRRAQTSSARHDLEQSRFNLRRDADNALQVESERAATLRAIDAELLIAEQSYQAQRERYVGSSGDVLTLLTTFSSLQVSQLTRLNAHRNLIAARIDLHRVVSAPSPVVEGG